MYTDPIAIVAPAPARLPASLAEFIAIGTIRKLTLEECIAGAKLIHQELDKVNNILDGVIAKMEAEDNGRLAESG